MENPKKLFYVQEPLTDRLCDMLKDRIEMLEQMLDEDHCDVSNDHGTLEDPGPYRAALVGGVVTAAVRSLREEYGQRGGWEDLIGKKRSVGSVAKF